MRDKSSYKDDLDLYRVADLITVSVSPGNMTVKNEFSQKFSELTLREESIFCKALAFLYWEEYYEKNNYSNDLRWRIVGTLSAPIGFCGKHESKRIALHSAHANERKLAMRFYEFNPSILDYPFLKEYVKLYGVETSPFPVYPDRFYAYNLKKYIEFLNADESQGQVVKFRHAANSLKKDIYLQIKDIWNEQFYNFAVQELLSFGYPKDDMVPQKYSIPVDDRDVIISILEILEQRKTENGLKTKTGK